MEKKTSPQEHLISVALAEVGYLEKASRDMLDDKKANAGDKNFTKYARDLDAITGIFNGRKQGVAWCAVFVVWCFVQSFGVKDARKLLYLPVNSSAAGCSSAAGYYKRHGSFVSSPLPGDQIFFRAADGDGFSHTGIVERVEGGKVYTIEGNTSAGKEVIPNGGAVCRKSYSLTNRRIGGFGRPDWPSIQYDGGGEPMSALYQAKVVSEQGSTVNLRKGPSTNATLVARVPVGAVVDVLATVDDEWAEIAYGEKTGYMMRKFLRKESQPTGDEETVILTLTKGVAEALFAALKGVVKG